MLVGLNLFEVVIGLEVLFRWKEEKEEEEVVVQRQEEDKRREMRETWLMRDLKW